MTDTFAGTARPTSAAIAWATKLTDRILRDCIIDENGCWLWQGATACGYGCVSFQGKAGIRIHRAIWEAANGPIPNALFVLHKCDVRHCCNPKHLFLGTQQDNIDDMRAKNRDNMLRNKLTPDQVRYIRVELATGKFHRVIAAELGVTREAISRIAQGRTWSHLL